MFIHVHIMCVHIVTIIWYKLYNFILKAHFLHTVILVFLLEYTVMLLLITSVKVRSNRAYMCKISSILLKFCTRSWQIFSKMFVIPLQISSIFRAWKEWQPCCILFFLYCLGLKIKLNLADQKKILWLWKIRQENTTTFKFQ